MLLREAGEGSAKFRGQFIIISNTSEFTDMRYSDVLIVDEPPIWVQDGSMLPLYCYVYVKCRIEEN